MSESEVTPSGDESATGTAAAEDAITGIEVTGELELEWPKNGFHYTYSLQHD